MTSSQHESSHTDGLTDGLTDDPADAHRDADQDGYDGAVEIVVDDHHLRVTARLRGYFEPLDGRYHWYGRIGDDEHLREVVGARSTPVVITSPHGRATGHLGEPDTWGRYRISGTGAAPFPVAATLAELE